MTERWSSVEDVTEHLGVARGEAESAQGRRHVWIQFIEGEKGEGQRQWVRETQSVRVEWSETAPAVGSHVVLEPSDGPARGLVLAPDLVRLGVLKSAIKKPRRDIVGAWVGDKPDSVTVEYFGPRTTR
jgi:hypothetical protein